MRRKLNDSLLRNRQTKRNFISSGNCAQGLVWKPLPSLVFGVGATFTGLLYVLLPETLGQVLPDTVEQAEQLGRRKNTERA